MTKGFYKKNPESLNFRFSLLPPDPILKHFLEPDVIPVKFQIPTRESVVPDFTYFGSLF